ncbi:MAG: SDR family NAD(P)-dependent oxidoreductase, partial [Flavobacterium sp.]
MKNIIITGTSRGIGLELALQLAESGHQILALSRKTNELLIKHPNIHCLSIDLSKPETFETVEHFLLKTWKNVDVVIHNAG